MEWFDDPMCADLRRALRECIKKHGPIADNHSVINSALKRIYGVLKREKQGQYEDARKKIMDRPKKSIANL